MRKLLLSVITAASLFASAAIAAPATTNLKLGVIDVQQILQKSPQIAAINNQLTKEFKPRQDKIVAAQKDLQAEADKLNKNGSTMSDADRNKLQDQIIADKANVQGMAISFQRDLQQAQNKAMQDFMNQLTGVVNDVAKKNGYDLILQRAGVPYANNNLDITAQVLQELNKK
jgi:outer membrane protein